MTQRELNCDVLVIGGGLVGSTLARALAELPLDTVLVEARDPAKLEQPSFDDRATALANGSQRILQGLGLWGELVRHAQPIRSIHVSERGRFGAARIEAAEEGVPALGYTVENRIIGKVLWEHLGGAPQLTCLAPATLASLTSGPRDVTAEIAAEGETVVVRAKLLAAADGARSGVRRALGIEASEDHYLQRALILNCATEAAHRGRAFERFTEHGPLALLPLTRERVAVVWSLSERAASSLMALGDAEFLEALQRSFGYRLGRIGRIGRRASYPLARVRSAVLGARRTLLIGSAAVNLHPVAGQGFNLALRDVATLAEILSDEVRAAGAPDLGCGAVLRKYRAWRSRDQRRVSMFTHALVRLFGASAAPLGIGRGLALAAFDVVPGAKAGLARHSMGLAGRLSRLARGLPL